MLNKLINIIVSNIWVYKCSMTHETGNIWSYSHFTIIAQYSHRTGGSEVGSRRLEKAPWLNLSKHWDNRLEATTITPQSPPRVHTLQSATTCGWRGSTPTWSSRASSSSSSRSSSAPCRQSCSPSLPSRFGKSSKLTWLTTRTAERKPHNLQPTVYSLQWMGVSPSG